MDGYSFSIDFEELDEDLISEKVDACIEHWFDNGEFDEGRKLNDLLEDDGVRSRAERWISSHFPVYF